MTDSISNVAQVAPVVSAPAQPGAAQAPSPARQQAAPATAPTADLQAVAESLRQAFQPAQTDLRFQVDKVTGQMVISVIDAQDGKTLLQIPDEEALAIAQSLEQMHASLIQRQA